MRILPVLFSFFFIIINANAQSFVYETSDRQSFKLRPGHHTQFQYVMVNRADFKHNSLFDIDENTRHFIIPFSGYYEAEAFFNFNPDTASIKDNRGGINFGLVHIRDGKQQYMAAARYTFDKTNQSEYTAVYVLPTIVYLKQGDIIAPAISSGYINTHLFYAHIGCPEKTDDCVSFSFKIRLISVEDGNTDFF